MIKLTVVALLLYLLTPLAVAATIDCYSQGTRVLHTTASHIRYGNDGTLIFREKGQKYLTFVNTDCVVRLGKHD